VLDSVCALPHVSCSPACSHSGASGLLSLRYHPWLIYTDQVSHVCSLEWCPKRFLPQRMGATH
jgi:hypothetical protein